MAISRVPAPALRGHPARRPSGRAARLAVLVAGGVLFSAAAARAGGNAPLRLDPGTPVFFLTIDTLRADELHRHDAGRDVTPFLDELASEGFEFTRCFAQSSWTLPSMLSLFSSVEPATIGVTVGVAVPEDPSAARSRLERQVFSDRFLTLVEVLRDQGYATRGINTNPLLMTKQGFPQGFDTYEQTDCLRAEAVCPLDIATQTIHDRTSSPLFLWVHLFDPHAQGSRRDPRPASGGRAGAGTKRAVLPLPTYPVPAGYEDVFAATGGTTFADSVRLDYARRVRAMDDRLREFFERPGNREFLDRALVVVAVDHGEEFDEKGRWDHGLSLANTLVHTPLLIRLPKRAARRGSSREIVRNLDVAPTILDLLGIPVPADFRGESLVPLLAGDPLRLEYVYGETHLGNRDLHFLIDPEIERKLVWNRKNDALRLYSLADDMAETTDLVPGEEDVARRMAAQLTRRLAEMEPQAPVETRTDDMDPEAIERLRALGYVGR